MSYDHSDYVAYGMQIHRLENELFWKITDDQKELVTQDVRLITGGEVDEDDHFLVTSWQKIRAAHPFLVPPYAGTDEPYITWDAKLVQAAELIDAKPMLQPGWLFIPDWS